MAAPESPSNSALLAVGKTCSNPSCGLVDFLPITCQHCSQPYCSSHFLPPAHFCSKYDASKHDRIAPPCPFCKEPVAIPPGQDPNWRMEKHIENDCKVLLGDAARRKASGGRTCAGPKCGKLLIVPIQCDTCKKSFCPTHRFPSSHTCTTSAPSSSTVKSSSPSASPKSENKLASFLRPKGASAASSAAMTAISRAASTPKTVSPTKASPSKPPQKTSNSKPSSSSSPSVPNPFNKTDRRAKAENESKLKALKERARKGLLTEEDKKALKEAEAKGDDSGCIIA